MGEPKIWPRYLGAIAAAAATLATLQAFAIYVCVEFGGRTAGWWTQCQRPACEATALWDPISLVGVVIAAVFAGIPTYLVVGDNSPSWLRRWVR